MLRWFGIAIKVHKPNEYTEDDWNYILDRHFLRDDFRVRSERNSQNRKNLQITHHLGSYLSTGIAPSHIELFYETQSKKGIGDDPTHVVDPHIQEKIDVMRQTLERNPKMSDYELTENVFG
ncbi:uncharacterized protein LOC124929888 [Impatiens glandulifera]|uniref:uncharacterized protein LOC124929888 n=1 Tax=Impatiens glandulifera TaxID=253017 RepID=UPI001FB07CBE|nr:uncharacterized protein LOC124929888 [Impatiens glandulifera]